MGDAKGLSERHLNRRLCLARWMRLTNAARAAAVALRTRRVRYRTIRTRILGRSLSCVRRPDCRQRCQRKRRQPLSAQHLRMPAARRLSRPVQVERRLHAAGNPLLRSGLNNTGEPPSARLFFVEPHAACNLDALRLRRASAMQAFRQVAHGVAADRHVLN